MHSYENYGVEPDIMTLAKPLAGGLPIGAVLMKQKVADVMTPGDHGTTFAGGPLVTHAANTVMGIINTPSFLADVKRKGEKLRSELREALRDNPHVKEVRGQGLLVGIQCDQMVGVVQTRARQLGLLVITAGKGDVVRLVPPLTINDREIESAVKILKQAINETLKPQ